MVRKPFRRVMEHAPNVPVVVLSGRMTRHWPSRPFTRGCRIILIKGNISSKHLERSIRYAVERQALLRALEMTQKQQLDFKNQFLLSRFARITDAAHLYSPVRNAAARRSGLELWRPTRRITSRLF